MSPISKTIIALLLLVSSPAGAWDYTTSDPCKESVEHRPAPDVAYTPDGSVPTHATGLPDQTTKAPYSATVDLNIPLASRINTSSYNADLSRSDIDVGTALVNQDGTYVNVLGNEVPAPSAPAANAATAQTKGCR